MHYIQVEKASVSTNIHIFTFNKCFEVVQNLADQTFENISTSSKQFLCAQMSCGRGLVDVCRIILISVESAE